MKFYATIFFFCPNSVISDDRELPRRLRLNLIVLIRLAALIKLRQNATNLTNAGQTQEQAVR